MKKILFISILLVFCGYGAQAQVVRGNSAGTTVIRSGGYSEGNGSGVRAIFNTSGQLILNSSYQIIAYQ